MDNLEDVARTRTLRPPPQRHYLEVPYYRAVLIVGDVLIILGAGTIVAGAIVGIYFTATNVAASSPEHKAVMLLSGVLGTILITILSLLPGIILVALGQLLLCVRDMARNSFR